MWRNYVVRKKRVQKSRACCMLYFFTAILVIFIAYKYYTPAEKQRIKHQGELPSRRMALGSGAIAGIIIGVLSVVVLVILIICCFICILRREQQVLHQHSIPTAYGGMPRSEHGRTGFYPGMWNNAYKYKINQRQQRFYQTQHQQQQQYYPNSDPHLRHPPQRAGSYGHQPHPQSSPSGPTVYIYQTDGYPERPTNAPRFYWHREAEEVTVEDSEQHEQRDETNSHTGEDSQTTNEPIVEFPDDDEEDS